MLIMLINDELMHYGTMLVCLVDKNLRLLGHLLRFLFSPWQVSAARMRVGMYPSNSKMATRT